MAPSRTMRRSLRTEMLDARTSCASRLTSGADICAGGEALAPRALDALVLPTTVTAVTLEIEPRFRALVRNVKPHAAYKEASAPRLAVATHFLTKKQDDL